MNKFSLFNEKRTPKIIGELNGQHVKLCKLQDKFVWHSHKNEDELLWFSKEHYQLILEMEEQLK